MNIRETLRWQCSDYGRYHLDSVNLVIHILAVTLMWAAVFVTIAALVKLSIVGVLVGVVGILFSMIAQNVGHKRELNPPVPFSGKADFFKRLLLEQFVAFPRFVLTGGWIRNFTNKAGTQ